MNDRFVVASQDLCRFFEASDINSMKHGNVTSMSISDVLYTFIQYVDESILKEDREIALDNILRSTEEEPELNMEFMAPIADVLIKHNIKRAEIKHIIAGLITYSVYARNVVNEYVNVEKYLSDSDGVIEDISNIENATFYKYTFGKVKDESDKAWYKIRFISLNAIISSYVENKIYNSMQNGSSVDSFDMSTPEEAEVIDSSVKYVKLITNEYRKGKFVDKDKIIDALFKKSKYIEYLFKKHPIGTSKEDGELSGDVASKKDFYKAVNYATNNYSNHEYKEVTEVIDSNYDKYGKKGISRMIRAVDAFNMCSIVDEIDNHSNNNNNNTIVQDSDDEQEGLEIYNSDEDCSDIDAKIDKLVNEVVSYKAIDGDYVNYDEFVHINRMISATVSKMQRNSVVLVGNSGIGKKTLINSIAYENKDACKVVDIDFEKLLVLSQTRDSVAHIILDVASRVSKEAVRQNEGMLVLFVIDKFDRYCNSSIDIGGIFKVMFKVPNLRCIFLSSKNGLARVEKESTIMSNCEVIEMVEPDGEDILNIVNQKKPSLEEAHEVQYDKDAIKFIIDNTHKVTDECAPSAQINLMDTIGAYTYTQSLGNRVNKEVVKKAFKDLFECEVSDSIETEADRLRKLRTNLSKRVFGQDRACEVVDDCIEVSMAGLNENNKTVCNLLFVGPTGVGKTELAKVVADTLQIPLIRYNMTEYQDTMSLNRLIGSAPGYVGYEEGGKLVSDVIENPKCVLLLDEIEKAHNNIYNVLLNIMDDAELTDGLGRTADFKDVILIMTSNAGARDIGTRKLGFSTSEENSKRGNEVVDVALEKTFKPEFLNRITEVVKFNFIDDTVGKLIIKKKVKELTDKLSKYDAKVCISDSGMQYILKKGISHKYGAREIVRIFTKEINLQIAHMMRDKKMKKGCTLSIRSNKDLDKILVTAINKSEH